MAYKYDTSPYYLILQLNGMDMKVELTKEVEYIRKYPLKINPLVCINLIPIMYKIFFSIIFKGKNIKCDSVLRFEEKKPNADPLIVEAIAIGLSNIMIKIRPASTGGMPHRRTLQLKNT